MRVDADLISIQEMDHFNDFFEPALTKLGYDGVFVPKVNSPSCSFGYFSDGVALFWRSSKFRPYSASTTENEPISLAQTPSPVVVACLQHIDSGKLSVIGTTHLKAKPGLANEERRKIQIDSLLSLMDKVITVISHIGKHQYILMLTFSLDARLLMASKAKIAPGCFCWEISIQTASIT